MWSVGRERLTRAGSLQKNLEKVLKSAGVSSDTHCMSCPLAAPLPLSLKVPALGLDGFLGPFLAMLPPPGGKLSSAVHRGPIQWA